MAPLQRITPRHPRNRGKNEYEWSDGTRRVKNGGGIIEERPLIKLASERNVKMKKKKKIYTKERKEKEKNRK